jgi:hypothetical protein
MLMGTIDIDGPFNGAAELGAKLASSRQFQKCSVAQLFRFAMGQGETEADAAAIYSIAQRFSLDQPVVELFSTFVVSPLFTERVPEAN